MKAERIGVSAFALASLDREELLELRDVVDRLIDHPPVPAIRSHSPYRLWCRRHPATELSPHAQCEDCSNEMEEATA